MAEHAIHFDDQSIGKLLNGGFWHINPYNYEYHNVNHVFLAKAGRHHLGMVKLITLAKPFQFLMLTEMHTLAALDKSLSAGREYLKVEFPSITPATTIAFAYYQWSRKDTSGFLWMLEKHRRDLGLVKEQSLSLF